MICPINLSAVTENVAVLVLAARFFVSQGDCFDAQHGQREQLGRFRDAVVIHILPEAEARKDRVSFANGFIAVAAIQGLVIFRKRPEAVSLFPQRW